MPYDPNSSEEIQRKLARARQTYHLSRPMFERTMGGHEFIVKKITGPIIETRMAELEEKVDDLLQSVDFENDSGQVS